MKKITKKSAQKPTTKQPQRTEAAPRRFGGWSLSIFVYWFIILFFVSATFYILGRGYGLLHPTTEKNNVEITEETLRGSNEYFDAGKNKLVEGDFGGAIADLTIALESDAKMTNAFILRGEAYMQIGEYVAALADFDSAISVDSKNSIAYYDRALLNMRLEDFQTALVDINNTLAAYTEVPNDILTLRDIYAKRGQLNLWLKNWEGAVADYTNSLAHAEGKISADVYAERAEALTAQNKYNEAIDDYMSAVRVISEQIQGAEPGPEREALAHKAMSYFEKSSALNVILGNMEAARSDLESAHKIALAFEDTETATKLRDLIMEIGDRSDALAEQAVVSEQVQEMEPATEVVEPVAEVEVLEVSEEVTEPMEVMEMEIAE